MPAKDGRSRKVRQADKPAATEKPSRGAPSGPRTQRQSADRSGSPRPKSTSPRTSDPSASQPADRGAPAPRDGKAARREAILAAGLHVFAEHGFEAARLDEVAARAGVAKGTLYLYFTDKTALFEEIVRAAAGPVRAHLEALAEMPDQPTRLLLQKLFGFFVNEVLGTDRKLILRLIISEGPRFPALAHFYHAEVVSRGLVTLTRIIERGIARGEIRSRAVAQFPQLVMAPLLVSLLWDGLFQSISPLDIARMLDAHIDLLTAPSPSAQ